MNVEFVAPLLMLAAMTHTTTAQCGGNLTAEFTFRTLIYSPTGNNNKTEETCTWYVSPNKTEPANSYLSLKWNKFDVRGKLPACSDYIEVFLTRSYKSIGRYCSDNMIATVPFNMYSYDGHAKIVFYSKMRIMKSSFSLTYDTYNRGKNFFLNSTSFYCIHDGDRTDANIFVTGGWPYGYASPGDIPCQIKYGTGQENTNSMIAVMDVDMECSGDFLRVFQTDTNDGYAKDMTGKVCGWKPHYFTATKKYVWIQYKRNQASLKRGGNVGYLLYEIDPSQIPTPPPIPTGNPWPDTSNTGSTARKISYINVSLAGFVILASLIY